MLLASLNAQNKALGWKPHILRQVALSWGPFHAARSHLDRLQESPPCCQLTLGGGHEALSRGGLGKPVEAPEFLCGVWHAGAKGQHWH